MVRLSALRTGRLYSPRNTPGTHFCYRLSRPEGNSATGRFKSMTPSGVERATFLLVAQGLNQLRNRVPHAERSKVLPLHAVKAYEGMHV